MNKRFKRNVAFFRSRLGDSACLGQCCQPASKDDPDMGVTGTHKAPGGRFPPSAVLATDLANKQVLALLLVQETTGWVSSFNS